MEPPRRAPRPSASTAAARRNENVHVSRIDTDRDKEAAIRIGGAYVIATPAPAERNNYTAEHGKAASELVVLRPSPVAGGFHGELFEVHQNSLFNARTFFQVGGVKPSRQNQYGGRFTAQLRGLGALTGSITNRKIRGMVNGNVLVPLANERTSTATDPALRALIGRYLSAYPAELPNRPDFDERALNTNAPQIIDELDGGLRLDRDFGSRWRLYLSHGLNRQRVRSFQLVAGQNPDMDIHNHRARATLSYNPSAATDISFGGGFTRNRSALVPEPNAVGARVRMGYQIEELGPDSHFPIQRATNTFRYGALASHRTGRHNFTAGGEVARYQLNGIETFNQRPTIYFTSNFGYTAIENLRAGRATTYEVALGEMARGFRNWSASGYFGDQWRASNTLQIYWGLRYSLLTVPREVDRLDTLPYRCDCNNFSPRLSIAWQLPKSWMLRTSYTVSFDQIPQVTFGQARYNPPNVISLQIQNPDVLNPLRGVSLDPAAARYSPILFSPDLVSPYAHQYNLSLERKLGSGMLRVGYLGSRSLKLMNAFVTNRADPVPGIPLTTATVNERRADPRYADVRTIMSAGIGYLDAAQASVELPRWRSIGGGVSYTFGKSLDQGSDYTSTAANRDLSRARSQSQYNILNDRKGLSNFDSPHSLVLYHYWDLPRVRSTQAWANWIAGGWQWTGNVLLKSGTPSTLYVGSDAPGFGNVDGGSSDRPNILDPSILGRTVSHPDLAPILLSRDKFDFIRPGQLAGNLGRNTFRRARIANWNGAIGKRWRLPGAAERFVYFRGEAINLSNTPQFDEPNRNLNASAFGKITNTLNDGRVFQFTLRFTL